MEKKIINDFDIAEDNELNSLIEKALELEEKNKSKYEMLVKAVKDRSIRNSIYEVYRQEEKHYEFIKGLFNALKARGNLSKAEKEIYKGSLDEALVNSTSDELDLIAIYNRINSLQLSKKNKHSISNIIKEKQKSIRETEAIADNNKYKLGAHLFFRVPAVISDKKIKYSNAAISVDLDIPVISGLNNGSIQKFINNSIDSDITEFKNQMEEGAKEDKADAESKGKKFVPYAAGSNYSITYNKNSILSASIIYNQLIQGKHSFIRTSYNYNTDTGRSLSLKDLFKPGVPYLSILNSEIKRQLQATNPSAAANFSGIAEDQPFYLENGNIVIYVSFNEIAPTASEIPVIRIPISKYRNQIKPEYFA